MIRKIKRWLQNWWRCRTQQCDYYRHYLAYGPADLTHIGYHSACRLSDEHFKNCRYEGTGRDNDFICPTCRRWEERLRA